MTDEQVEWAESWPQKPFILFRIFQWALTAFAALFLPIHLQFVSRLDLPDASKMLFATSVGVAALYTVFVCPLVFYRVTSRWKYLAYPAIIIPLILFGLVRVNVEDAFYHTPEGQKQAAAARVEQKKRWAEEDRKNELKMAADEKRREAESVQTDIARCTALVPQIQQMEKDGKDLEIIEINGISGSPYSTCSGIATTNRGTAAIQFRTEQTPQGRILLNVEFPHGIN